jgi:hypothetical protein
MRNMSFSMTTKQIRDRTKTVTRRFGWWFLKPGDYLCAVEKGQGLKKGEKIKRICKIEVVSVRREILWKMGQGDCAKEGFPQLTLGQFLAMFCKSSGKPSDAIVNRIEFKYV